MQANEIIFQISHFHVAEQEQKEILLKLVLTFPDVQPLTHAKTGFLKSLCIFLQRNIKYCSPKQSHNNSVLLNLGVTKAARDVLEHYLCHKCHEGEKEDSVNQCGTYIPFVSFELLEDHTILIQAGISPKQSMHH